MQKHSSSYTDPHKLTAIFWLHTKNRIRSELDSQTQTSTLIEKDHCSTLHQFTSLVSELVIIVLNPTFWPFHICARACLCERRKREREKERVWVYGWVCVRVYMCACVCIYIYIYMYIYIGICIYICIYIHIYMYVYIYIHVCIYTYIC